MTGTLTAVGRSGIIQMQPGQSFTYALTVASEESFIGTVQVRRSRNLAGWEPLVSKVGTVDVPLTTDVDSGTIVNETGRVAWYDVAVIDYGETSNGVSYVVAAVTDQVVQTFKNDAGTPILELYEDHVAVPALTVTGALTLTGPLAGSHSVLKTEAATHTVLAAHATKARLCLVVITVDETYAAGTGTLPTIKIGEDDTTEKCLAATVLTDQTAGTVLTRAFTNTATKKIIITSTAAAGNATGGCTVSVIAMPVS
jgi:hypothetical protein